MSGEQTCLVEPFCRKALVPASLLVAVLVALSGRYGFHRDELYFIESAKHAAWGYVDNPSITPMIGWLSQHVFGDSLSGLRALPAIEAGAIVVIVTAIAREVGATRSAQLLTAIVTATSSFVFAIGHLLTTPTFDVLM